MKIWRQLGVLLVLAMLLASCDVPGLGGDPSPVTSSPVAGRPTSPSATPAPGVADDAAADQVVEGGLAEPRTLNPVLVADPISEELSHLVFNGLVVVDPASAKPEGDLARSWDISDDRLTYTFHLRDAVTWQDGQPFTAQDVVFTYQLMMNDRTRSPRYSELVERVSEVHAPDLKTVVFTLIHPDAAFLVTLATFGIVPEHLLSNVLPEELVTDPFGLSSAIGTGPFTLAGWSHGDRLIFSRNDRYFKQSASYGQYVYKIVSTPQDLVKGLADGSIDWGQLDPAVVDSAGADARIRVASAPGDELEYVALQLDSAKQKLFLDSRVRQALMLALDRDGLVHDVWHGQASVANGIISPSSWAYAESSISYSQDLDQARSLLTEAGWNTGDDGIRTKDGQRLRLKLVTNGDNALRQQMVQILIAQWRVIGVEVVPDFEKWSTIEQEIIRSRNFDSALLGFRGSGDPDQSTLWSSDSFFDGLNLGHYSNPEVDQLLESALRSDEPAERADDYAKAQEAIMHDLPVLPLVYPKVVVGFSERLRDVSATAILIRNRANIEQWHLAPGG